MKKKKKSSKIVLPNEIKKLHGKRGNRYFYDGRIISRAEYWTHKLKYLILTEKDLYINIKLNETYIRKLVLVMHLYGSISPNDCFKQLLDQMYGLSQIKKRNEEKKKK